MANKLDESHTCGRVSESSPGARGVRGRYCRLREPNDKQFEARARITGTYIGRTQVQR